MRYIKQSTRDDMSGNWNGEILDMDEEREKNDQSICSLVHDALRERKKTSQGFWFELMSTEKDSRS